MEHIASHMSRGRQKDNATERGELMRYFMQKLNMTRGRDGLPQLTMPRMGRVLQAIPTRDLYYLKSVCDDAAKRGDSNSFSKKFWWEVNPKKHQGEESAESKPKKRVFRKSKKKSTEDYD